MGVPKFAAHALVIIIIHGVSGSGKTTIGRLLAGRLGWRFFDADDFHSVENKERMRRCVALSDADRQPWLLALKAAIERQVQERANAVFAISALKEEHRAQLRVDADVVQFVFLDIQRQTARERLEKRRGHFFSAQLLDSQFATLERPAQGSMVVDAALSPGQIVDEIVGGLGLGPHRVR